MKGRYLHHEWEKYKSIKRGTMGLRGGCWKGREEKKGRVGDAELKAVGRNYKLYKRLAFIDFICE